MLLFKTFDVLVRCVLIILRQDTFSQYFYDIRKSPIVNIIFYYQCNKSG